MDLQIYNAILIERGINPYAYDTKKVRKYPNGERAFRHDIFKNKTMWTGNRKRDFWLFITSYHPMIGIFTVCDHHPYTKRKRMLTLSMMMCVGSFWASISAIFSLWARSKSNPLTYFDAYLMKLVVSTCNGAMLWLMEICLRHLTQCVCRENLENKYSNCCCKLLTKCGVFVWYLVAMLAVFLCLDFVIVYDAVSDFIIIFLSQFLISWMLQIIGLYIKFRIFWKRDNDAMQKLTRSRRNASIELSKTKPTFMKRVKSVLDSRKRRGYPYYISYEESNEWILRNLWYQDPKQRRKSNIGMHAPLLSKVGSITETDHEEMLSLLSNDLADLSEDEECDG